MEALETTRQHEFRREISAQEATMTFQYRESSYFIHSVLFRDRSVRASEHCGLTTRLNNPLLTLILSISVKLPHLQFSPLRKQQTTHMTRHCASAGALCAVWTDSGFFGPFKDSLRVLPAVHASSGGIDSFFFFTPGSMTTATPGGGGGGGIMMPGPNIPLGIIIGGGGGGPPGGIIIPGGIGTGGGGGGIWTAAAAAAAAALVPFFFGFLVVGCSIDTIGSSARPASMGGRPAIMPGGGGGGPAAAAAAAAAACCFLDGSGGGGGSGMGHMCIVMDQSGSTMVSHTCGRMISPWGPTRS